MQGIQLMPEGGVSDSSSHNANALAAMGAKIKSIWLGDFRIRSEIAFDWLPYYKDFFSEHSTDPVESGVLVTYDVGAGVEKKFLFTGFSWGHEGGWTSRHHFAVFLANYVFKVTPTAVQSKALYLERTLLAGIDSKPEQPIELRLDLITKG